MKKLNFELYQGASKATSSFNVYLDTSSDAVENSHYYDTASYTSQKLTGTNGFSAITETSISNNLFRIRILLVNELCFCSAWFKLSTAGYADYIPYYGTNGPSNGLYRIVVPSNYYKYIRTITGTTSIYGMPSINKTIPCTMYLFWAGGYLNGGTTYPPIIGMDTFNIGDTYSIYVPTSTLVTGGENTVTYYIYHHNQSSPERERSFINDYGLEAPGRGIVFRTGTTHTLNLEFSPQTNVICTGKMAESISYCDNEFPDDVCLPGLSAITHSFNCADGSSPLARFNSVKKKHSIILNTVILSNGTINQMSYRFTGNSNTYEVSSTSFPSTTSGCSWQAYIDSFLGAYYNTSDLKKSVAVEIRGYISQVSGWYYKVVAYDGTVIQITTAFNSSNSMFTTTMEKLDGATVFFARTSNISNTYWNNAKKATDGSRSHISTQNVYSWTGSTGGGGTSTTSLDSIGEFDYQ